MSDAAASPISRDTIYAEIRLNQQLRRLEQERIVSWPLAIGFMVGIFVVLAGAPAMLIVGSYMDKYSNEKKSRQASFSVEKEMQKPKQLTPEEEEQLLKLGIDDGTEKSTMTWIGYKDYQEQFAKKSEVEQAAFKETDAGGQPAQAQPNQQASPPTQAQQQAQAQQQTPPPTPQTPPAQQPATPTVVAQAEPPPTPSAPAPTETAPPVQAPDTTQAVAPPPMPVSLALPETPKVANPAAVVPLADERKIETQILPIEKVGDSKDDKVPPEPLKMPPPDSKPTDQKPNDLKPNEAKPTDAKPIDEKQPDKPADVKPTDEKPLEATKPQVKPPDTKPPEKTAEAKPAQPTTPQQPTVATPPPSPASPPQQQAAASPPANPSQQTPATQAGTAPGKPADGEKSDRESDATSIVDVPQAKWRNGRPLAGKGLNVRTQRPVFDELTTISTGGTNPIVEIEFDKEGVPKNCVILQSSGTQLIDQPIIDCLYRWRASGSQLEKLSVGKTLKYRIRMLLTK
jgi:hypothetical protein